MMKTQSISILCLVLSILLPTLSLLAQKETWYFGLNCTGLQFDGTGQLPTPLHGHALLSNEGSAQVVDPVSGEILFYSDGMTVFNSQHQIIENGTDLGGCPSAAHAAAIAPIPGRPNQYYLFTNSKGSRCDTPSQLQFYTVDMNANCGLGAVTAKDHILRKNIDEGMIVISDQQSDSTWLVGVDILSSTITHFVYSIQATGCFLHKEYKVNESEYNRFSISYSEKSKKIAFSGRNEIYTLDFNATTGELNTSSYFVVNKKFSAYDFEWSPDGSKLYYSYTINPELFQFDFNTGKTETIIPAYKSSTYHGGGLQLGPDGRIYYNLDNNSTKISTINQPNLAGANCQPDIQNIELHRRFGGLKFSTLTAATSPLSPTADVQSGIINDYAKVTAICHNCLEVPSAHAFSPGDTILLIQMQDAIANTSNTSAFGQVIDYGASGQYEFNVIRRIDGNEICLEFRMENIYNPMAALQVIRTPNIGDARVCQLTCAPWNGETGGVLAFFGGVISMEHDIDVSGKGFRGGLHHNKQSPGDHCASSYYFPEHQIDSAGQKGEGLVIKDTTWSRGRGAISIGGGGGNNHNGGGAGGANWGAGGLGGFFHGCRAVLHYFSLGGYAIDYSWLKNRLFAGGGGGAGHANNNCIRSGGAGGGIIVAVVDRFVFNGYAIKANGAHAQKHSNVNCHDGGGGGGAGGTVWLRFKEEQVDALRVEVKGGQGASVQFDHGHGGGGGGGVLFLNKRPTGPILFDASGGDSGKGTDGNRNKAQMGQPGGITASDKWNFAHIPFEELAFDSILLTAECDGSGKIQILVRGGETNYQFALNHNKSGNEALFDSLSQGDHHLLLIDGCRQLDTTVFLTTYPVLNHSAPEVQFRRCDSLGFFKLNPIHGKPPYRLRLLNQQWQDSYLFEGLIPDFYSWEIQDDRNCPLNGSIEIKDSTSELTPKINTETVFRGCPTQLSTQIPSIHGGPYRYSWMPKQFLDCSDCAEPIAHLTESTLFSLQVQDIFGCSGWTEEWLYVADNPVYIPNIFSPNGDGHNDYFTAYADEAKDLLIRSLVIVDRWGNQVFENQNFRPGEEQAAWDGSLDGQPMPAQVLMYHFEIQLPGGRIIPIAGDVSLIK